MKKKKPKRSSQGLQAYFRGIVRRRTRAIGELAQLVEGSEAHGLLSKLISDLNEEIAQLEAEARV